MGGQVVLAATGMAKRNPVLVAGKLDEPSQLLLGEALQGSPEKLDMAVGLDQADMIRGVSLQVRRKGGK